MSNILNIDVIVMNSFDFASQILMREQPGDWCLWYRKAIDPEQGEYEIIRIAKGVSNHDALGLFYDAPDETLAKLMVINLMKDFGMTRTDMIVIIESSQKAQRRVA